MAALVAQVAEGQAEEVGNLPQHLMRLAEALGGLGAEVADIRRSLAGRSLGSLVTG